MIKNISDRVGLTPTEIKVLLFLIVVLLIGFGVKNFFFNGDSPYKEYDYSQEDSVFNGTIASGEILLEKNDKIRDKNVDYKQEVLDFNNSEFRNNENKTIPAKASININTAGIEDFARLPGIGKKTAEKIIIFRKKIGGFKKLNELLKVKGIGNSKFINIKKYIYIE